ncbi:hypothetical protein L249_1297 [Ophiocordyceps polyrhachis-furcata BCC 54312]|uniref:Uncharacterized protein n=1 Tax=Ophiocordyceps polyrhachis-furcata BCC 54312 TaxID=1330021 RepID=A0A367LD83_9HYPO|nr:hypothetical protein L249_1297 [Ophiocordyceps polyrhachis-furcata BCC 54312]
MKPTTLEKDSPFLFPFPRSGEARNVAVDPFRPKQAAEPDMADLGNGIKQQLDDDKEWETEADDDDRVFSTEATTKPNNCARAASRISRRLDSSARSTQPSPIAHPATRCSEQHIHCSSIYSEASKGDEHAVDQPPGRLDCSLQEHNNPRPLPPATLWPQRSTSGGGETAWSKTSSSISMERFKFDRGMYSLLMSSAEREVSNTLDCARISTDTLVTVIEQPPKKIKPGPELSSIDHNVPVIKGECANPREEPVQSPVPTKNSLDTDGDWQTITTERPHEPIREIELNFAKGAGSSLADVSDTSADDVRNAQLDDLSAKAGYLAQSTLDEFGLARQCNHHLAPPRANTGHASHVFQMPQRPARAAEAIRCFSNPFRQDFAPPPDAAFEMAKLSNSYDSLESGPIEVCRKGIRYSNKLGQDPPKLPSVMFDRQSNWPSFRQSTGYKEEGLVSRDTSRLPFPLISLPEAARLQSFRRERGQEDHTDPPGFFAARVRSARSATVSTMSTVNSPMTPLSAYVDWQANMSPRGHGRARAACPGHGLPRQPCSPNPFHSGSPRPKTGRKLFGQDVSDSSSIIEARILRLRGFAMSAREIRAGIGHESSELSEIELMERGRGRALHGGQPGKTTTPLRVLFWGIRVTTVIFPLVGILALCGHFDSTISWYSRGQRHSLLTRQRFILKRQLLVELVMYAVLITALVVYYSLHGQRSVE